MLTRERRNLVVLSVGGGMVDVASVPAITSPYDTGGVPFSLAAGTDKEGGMVACGPTKNIRDRGPENRCGHSCQMCGGGVDSGRASDSLAPSFGH